MELMPIKTRVITSEDDIVDVLVKSIEENGLTIEDDDILVVAETPLGTTEGQVVQLSGIDVSPEAERLAERYSVLPAVAELVIREADEILGGIPNVLLTIKDNTLMANAGVDKSNVPPGFASLLPRNSRKSAERIRHEIRSRLGMTVGVMIIDSRTQPLRLGNVGMALGVAGFKPVSDDRGRRDLFGNTLRVTRRAVADNLASACTLLMGESDEGIPAVLVRGAPVEHTNDSFDSSEMWISPEECMYMAIFSKWRAATD